LPEVIVKGSLRECHVRLVGIQKLLRLRNLQGMRILRPDEEWMVSTSRLGSSCLGCRSLDGQVFPGSRLKPLFPLLSFVSSTSVSLNIHPHCGCVAEWVDSHAKVVSRLHAELEAYA
jgi:hypothetical protein